MSTTTEEKSRRWALVTASYQLAQAKISSYDTISFQIKGWAITVWAAFIGFTRQMHPAESLLCTIAPIILFWSLDIMFKFFQEQFLKLSARLETVMINEVVSDTDLEYIAFSRNIHSNMLDGARPSAELLLVLRRYWVHVLYVGMIVIALGAAAVNACIRQ